MARSTAKSQRYLLLRGFGEGQLEFFCAMATPKPRKRVRNSPYSELLMKEGTRYSLNGGWAERHGNNNSLLLQVAHWRVFR